MDPRLDQFFDEPSRVWAWRLETLVHLGYTWETADQLARTPIDLHELETLIRKGCPTELAAQILG